MNFGLPPDLTLVVAENLILIGLTLKSVEAHKDDWVGDSIGGSVPIKWGALFWVVSMPKDGYLVIQVGEKSHRMCQGDFIVFKDTVMHSVVSKYKWHACLYQGRFQR